MSRPGGRAGAWLLPLRSPRPPPRAPLEERGGVAYLSQLVTELPTPLGVEYYAQIVQRDAVYRRLIDAAGKITQLGYQGGADLGAALSGGAARRGPAWAGPPGP